MNDAVAEPAADPKEERVHRVVYECPRCGARQCLAFFADEQAFQVIGCGDCEEGRGSGMTIPQMLQRKVGMFPIGTETQILEKGEPTSRPRVDSAATHDEHEGVQ